MRVHQLSNGANQPFYNVLVQDGTCRYAAQGTRPAHRCGDGKYCRGEQVFASYVIYKIKIIHLYMFDKFPWKINASFNSVTTNKLK